MPYQVNSASEIIYEAVDTNANIKFGALIDESNVSGDITITVIATGFPDGVEDGLGTSERSSDHCSEKYWPVGRRRPSAGAVSRDAVAPAAQQKTSFVGRLKSFFGFQRYDVKAEKDVSSYPIEKDLLFRNRESSFKFEEAQASIANTQDRGLSASGESEVPDFIKDLKRSKKP